MPSDPPDPVAISIPGLRVYSGMNAREHWAARKRKAKEQRELVTAYLTLFVSRSFRDQLKAGQGLAVRFTRVGGQTMDSDNLTIAFKHCRDAVATYFGIDDGAPWWRWELPPGQEAGAVGVRIELAAGG